MALHFSGIGWYFFSKWIHDLIKFLISESIHVDWDCVMESCYIIPRTLYIPALLTNTHTHTHTHTHLLQPIYSQARWSLTLRHPHATCYILANLMGEWVEETWWNRKGATSSWNVPLSFLELRHVPTHLGELHHRELVAVASSTS